MVSYLAQLFDDPSTRALIIAKLPYLFWLAQLESSRAGKIGMQVGSLREGILVALLIHQFGEENVEMPAITDSEIDVRLFGEPISIKTITGNSGVKAIWTVDAQKARLFVASYAPVCDMLLAQIWWDLKESVIARGVHPGGLFWVPIEVQRKTLGSLGKDVYLKLPKEGTNPRGVEISKEGLAALLQDRDTRCIEIVWKRSQIDYVPYKRWVDYWKE